MTAQDSPTENAAPPAMASAAIGSWRSSLAALVAGYFGAVAAGAMFPLVIAASTAENFASALSEVTLEGVAWYLALGGIGAAIGAATGAAVFMGVGVVILLARLHRWTPFAATLAGAATGHIAAWSTFTTSPEDAQKWLANFATIAGALGAGVAAWLAHWCLARRSTAQRFTWNIRRGLP